jgi:hypothetical protein
MPTGTLFQPTKIEELNSAVVNYNGYGITGPITPLATTNLDLTFADDMIVTSIELIVNDPQNGDYMVLSVVHPSGVVLNTFVPRWYMGITSFRSFYQIAYPAKLVAGLILRASYVSTNATAPTFVAGNFGLHKVLW